MRLIALLRTVSLTWMLATTAFVLMAPPTVEVAQARKRRKKKKRRAPAVQEETVGKDIKKSVDMAPREEIELDTNIAKTKNLKEKLDKSGPTLSPEELRKAEFESLLEDKIDEEIDLARQVRDLEPTCEARSPLDYRLGDLYWEKSKRSFFKANDFSTPESSRKRYAAQMKRLQNQTLQSYQTIVDSCPTYDDYPRVVFYLGKAKVEMERWDAAVQHFKTLIQDYPDTEWLGQAWFMVGEYYFSVDNNARKAFKAYRKAEEAPPSPVKGFAVYKQGWCHINTGDWVDAAERFKLVINIADDTKEPLDHRQRAGLRKEALKDFVRAYSHIGEPNRAAGIFERLGGRKKVATMMEQLGKWYIDRDAHRETIEIHRDLIKRYPASTRLPIFQGRIVNAAAKIGDDRATVEQVKKLTRYFKQVREKAASTKLKKAERQQIDKDLKEAEDIAENTLRGLALDYHKEAKKLRGKAQDRNYRYAHDLYKHYLEVFPKPKEGADVNYVFFMRYYYAEVLYQLEKFKDAAENYDMVVDLNPDPTDKREKEIVLRAAEDSVRAWDELVLDEERIKGQPKVSGTTAKPIPPIYQRLIKACKRYKHYIGPSGDRSVEIAYKEARTNYIFNHFNKAAPAFNYIVKNHADRDEACYSANLVLDIYNGLKNFKLLRKSTRAYLKNPKLCASAQEDRAKFAKIEEQATFFLIKNELEDKKKHIAAGNAYMDFYRQYGKKRRPDGSRSHYAIDAVYNAAVNYDLGGRIEKSNEVREFLVKTFDDETDPKRRKLVVDTAFNIAQSYERVVDFEAAARYYEGFAAKYREDKRSKDAIFNAGLYRATLGDYALAKKDRESFLSLYAGDADAHTVAYAICETLQREAEAIERKGKNAVGKWTEAHDCFYGWIRNKAYVKKEPDLLCHAQFRRGEIMRLKTKYAKGFKEQKNYLYKMWPSWKKKEGLDKMPRCANAIAQLQFQDLRDDYKQYIDLRISELNPAKPQKFQQSLKAKVERRDKLTAEYKKVAEIGVAEWALGSLYMIGEAYRDSIDKVLNAPIPKKVAGEVLTADLKQLLKEQLQQQVAPIEGVAVDAYRLCVDKANELGVYNRWSVKALDQLQKLRPQEYPLVVERLASLNFPDELEVVKNSVVALEGKRFVNLDQAIEKGAGAPGAKKKDAKKGKGKGKGKSKGKSKGKDGSDAGDVPEEESDDGIPKGV